jgi:antitoxin VapB
MLNIKHPEADRLARTLAQQMNETITEVVIEALREKLLRERGKRAPTELKKSLLDIASRCTQLPNQNLSSSEDILGYDEQGSVLWFLILQLYLQYFVVNQSVNLLLNSSPKIPNV